MGRERDDGKEGDTKANATSVQTEFVQQRNASVQGGGLFTVTQSRHPSCRTWSVFTWAQIRITKLQMAPDLQALLCSVIIARHRQRDMHCRKSVHKLTIAFSIRYTLQPQYVVVRCYHSVVLTGVAFTGDQLRLWGTYAQTHTHAHIHTFQKLGKWAFTVCACDKYISMRVCVFVCRLAQS